MAGLVSQEMVGYYGVAFRLMGTFMVIPTVVGNAILPTLSRLAVDTSDGKMHDEVAVSFDAAKLLTGLEVIANQLGKKLDEDNPSLHAQLPDGSRLAAWIPPIVRPSPALAIRKFTSRRFTIDDLIQRGTISRSLAEFLGEQIAIGKTLLISGGT